MDDTDRKLMVILCAEPRIHCRELARRLRISAQAVHHRIRALTDLGVLKKSTATISVAYLRAVTVLVHGQSKTISISEALDRLGKSEFTRRVVTAGGNYMYVVGILRTISELDGYVDFVKREAEIPDPGVGIYCLDDGLPCNYSVDGVGKASQCRRTLSPLDIRIIASLKNDARRPIADIAHDVGASPKTVRRHLEAMLSDGSMEISSPGDLGIGGDFFMVMHVDVKNHADRKKVAGRLLAKNYFQDQYIRTFSNLPNSLIWVFWSDKINDIRRALRESSDDEDVLSTMLNFAYLERIYTTWREGLLEAPARAAKRERKRDVSSLPRSR